MQAALFCTADRTHVVDSLTSRLRTLCVTSKRLLPPSRSEKRVLCRRSVYDSLLAWPANLALRRATHETEEGNMFAVSLALKTAARRFFDSETVLLKSDNN